MSRSCVNLDYTTNYLNTNKYRCIHTEEAGISKTNNSKLNNDEYASDEYASDKYATDKSLTRADNINDINLQEIEQYHRLICVVIQLIT